MEMPETRYARSGDVNIAYQVFGEGDVPLIWVPSFMQHLELSWEEPNRRSWYEGLAASGGSTPSSAEPLPASLA
jgi:hypothetical protein